MMSLYDYHWQDCLFRVILNTFHWCHQVKFLTKSDEIVQVHQKLLRLRLQQRPGKRGAKNQNQDTWGRLSGPAAVKWVVFERGPGALFTTGAANINTKTQFLVVALKGTTYRIQSLNRAENNYRLCKDKVEQRSKSSAKLVRACVCLSCTFVHVRVSSWPFSKPICCQPEVG